MALPQVGNSISMFQINVELGLPGTTTISLNQSSVRTLFGVASGSIGMFTGFGKSNASAPIINSQPGLTVSGQCNGYIEYSVGNSGAAAGNASYTLYYVNSTQAQNTSGYYCNYYAVPQSLGGATSSGQIWTTGSGISSSGGTLGFNVAGGYHYRLRLTNSIGTTWSNWVAVSNNSCYDDCACTDGSTLGCYNCSETCTCDPCTYDCNCDCATGYGTGGCDCGSDCNWCDSYWDPDTGYPNENPNWPCPCGRMECPTYCSCPCGESCQYWGSYQCNEVNTGNVQNQAVGACTLTGYISF